MSEFDLVVRGGTVYDGTGAPSRPADVGIRDGKVAAISSRKLPAVARTIDAAGKWVIPGMLDVHTHYDAEVLAAPGLGESVRHGVTSVVIGNCSLSTVYAEADDCADMFARVEALPRELVRNTVAEHKSWRDPSSYAAALGALPLGANVAAFLGHSDIRVATMGLARAVDPAARPTAAEVDRMQAMLTDALDAGFVGLSTIRSSFSKLAGTRFPARRLPSTYARWWEYRALNRVLRHHDRVHQSTPNLTSRREVVLYLAESMGQPLRVPLRTTLIAAADIKADRRAARAAAAVAALVNRAGADFRWQHLPVPFEVYADGVDLVVFEEFGSGVAALNICDEVARGRLLADESYRRSFRKDLAARFGARVWHRDLYDGQIVACPEADVVGMSFGAVADARGIEPADAFLDLAVAHGSTLRWRTVIANDRDDVLDRLQGSPHIQVGFSDSGAHLRNMAFYNSGLRMLERSYRRGYIPMAAAVRRVTGELADWYGLDAGYLADGRPADLAVIDPAGFDGASAAYAEAEVPEFGGLSRMVNRNDRAVAATVVGGQLLQEYGKFVPGFGTTLRAGRFLRASRR